MENQTERITGARICEKCNSMIHDSTLEKCPTCECTSLHTLASLNLPEPCVYADSTGEQCEADAVHGKFCEDHAPKTGEDANLRRRLQQVADEIYSMEAQDPPKMTDIQIINAVSAGLKQRIRSTQYGRKSREDSRMAKRLMDLARAKGIDPEKDPDWIEKLSTAAPKVVE